MSRILVIPRVNSVSSVNGAIYSTMNIQLVYYCVIAKGKRDRNCSSNNLIILIFEAKIGTM